MADYDIIVIGGGHAGIEAAMAAARMGRSTLMVTLNKNTIGLMSCNPAIGGVGKGQLVREIDALGGQMARAADACGIQFRVLNASKGAAVQSSRAQIDMGLYASYMAGLINKTPNVTVKEAEVAGLMVEGGMVRGVVTSAKEEIRARCTVIAPGTFLDGVMHVGLSQKEGGRINEPSSKTLPASLKSLGLNILRFKTGTCARLDKNTIDFSKLIIQDGDCPAQPFSFSTHKIPQQQVPCYITYTNKKTHETIRKNLDRSPLYSGVIKSTGARYCPSIEDKIVKFADRARHQVFLEPQGIDTDAVYPNGLSTSLPEDVQLELIHSIEGLEEAKVLRFGYGIEHSVVEPTQLYPSLETKLVKNLYLAGQINGTTGYEEAAAQGLVAGINAALRAENKGPLVLERSNSYIGVLIDDLTTKGTNEPYRMFTSRVEYRLILREDNADLRLGQTGYGLGLVSQRDYKRITEKKKAIKDGINLLKSIRVRPTREVNSRLDSFGVMPLSRAATLEELLRRPQLGLASLMKLDGKKLNIPDFALKGVEIEVKYSGYIKRQLKDVERFEHLEKISLPRELDFAQISGLSREIKEKLERFKPFSLGQASRISGVTPAAVTLLMVYLRKYHGQKLS